MSLIKKIRAMLLEPGSILSSLEYQIFRVPEKTGRSEQRFVSWFPLRSLANILSSVIAIRDFFLNYRLFPDAIPCGLLLGRCLFFVQCSSNNSISSNEQENGRSERQLMVIWWCNVDVDVAAVFCTITSCPPLSACNSNSFFLSVTTWDVA